MKWGGITWIFLHTLSYKVHPDHYKQIKLGLWSHIKKLCNYLPCPECASHASQYLSRLSVPDTKDKLIQVLVDFHNVVNTRIRKPTFLMKEFNKYGTVDLSRAFYACKHVIKTQPYNPRLIMHKIQTWSSLDQFQRFLKQQRMIV